MSDIVKASIIIGIAIFLSQGFYSISSGERVSYVTNKLTGETKICAQSFCRELPKEK